MSAATAASPATPATIRALAPAVLERFVDDGMAIVPHLITREEAATYRAAALAYAATRKQPADGQVFRQLCNVFPQDEVLRSLTFHPAVVAAVTQLANGRSMRLYHDQLLIKDPNNQLASEFHQDRPYWPLTDSFTCSIWMALDDCTRERGCMSFIPGSHRRTGLPLQVITWAHDLFDKCPELEWQEQVVAPMQAGGATFHQGWTAHRAGPNTSDTPRVAFSAIFVESHTCFTANNDFLAKGMQAGDQLPDGACPRIC
jgi:phytanoyl-CoA hydroxylase